MSARTALGTAAGLGAFVVGLWACLRYVGTPPGEVALVNRLRVTPSVGAGSQLLAFFGEAGTPYVALLTVGLTAAVLARSYGPWTAAMVVVASGAAVLNDIVREVLGPTPTPSGAAITASTVESYPSGHAAYVASFLGALGWVAWRRGRRDVVVILVGLSIAMGVARVATGAHLPTDVAGGYALGGAWALVVLTAFGSRLRITGP